MSLVVVVLESRKRWLSALAARSPRRSRWVARYHNYRVVRLAALASSTHNTNINATRWVPKLFLVGLAAQWSMTRDGGGPCRAMPGQPP